MTYKEILYKVIQKLKNDGTLPDSFNLFYRHGAFDNDIIKYWINNNLIESIIFSHDFAKAFWGNERIGLDDIKDHKYYNVSDLMTNEVLKWEYHLQKMVLEKEPLKYLEKFL